MLQ
ncbi:hypothetical protein YPPY45_2624, partial [Yersinia pestis PY-45]|jgi:hypothetical protein